MLPMKKFLVLILTVLALSCSHKHLNKSKIYIQDDKLYGEIDDGLPDETIRKEIKDKSGKLLGVGLVAVNSEWTSNLKVGKWLEYNDSGVLYSEGNYKLGSYLDCGVGGLFRAFYYYRDGKWNYYNADGTLKYNLTFSPTELYVHTNCQGGDKLIFGLIKDVPLEFSHKIDADGIYKLQKTKIYSDNLITTMIPLNGKVNIEVESTY
tara:strand:- start:4211 stop:4831 length:621 start_codon:yes stop_codon:yes gene_type:complete